MPSETCPYCARKPRYGAGGLCGVHQSRKLAGEPMVQPHDLVGLQASGYGLLGVMDRTATHLMCHECGRWFKALGRHILTHGMTVAEAGRRLGVSHDTVQRWRIRLLHHG